MKKRENNILSNNKANLYFRLGLNGLKISLSLLIFFMILLLAFLFLQKNSFSDITNILFVKPAGQDYLVLFAGSILFIVVPYLLGIKTGLTLKKKIRK